MFVASGAESWRVSVWYWVLQCLLPAADWVCEHNVKWRLHRDVDASRQRRRVGHDSPAEGYNALLHSTAIAA